MKPKEKYSLNMHLARFGTDQACHDYLIQVRWNGKPECPKCSNNHMNYFLSTRKLYKCSQCYKQFSVIQGTIFERSRIPLSTWFMCIYLFATKKRGVSSIQMGKWLGVKQHTAWYMLHRLREAIKNENEILLNGKVEADEVFIYPEIARDKRLQVARKIHEREQDRINGYSNYTRRKMGEKLKRGRKKGTTKEIVEQMKKDRGGERYKSWKLTTRIPFEQGTVVFGMIERHGRAVFKKLGTDTRCVNQPNIFPLLQKHITPTSTLITDQLSVYSGAQQFFAAHLTINHKIKYVDGDVHTNTIENAWNHLRRMIDGTYFHLSYRHFDRYLDEYSYRWNRREESELILFENFIPLVVDKKISYRTLVNKEGKLAA